MLTFITSLRAKALAKDWDHTVWLLARCLDSLLNQTHPDFQIVVVCHDVPALAQLQHPKVHIITVSFAPPERTFDDMCVDKVLKLTLGVERAIATDSRFVMFVDADDLVSRRICEFTHEHADENGWVFQRGHAYRYGDHFMRHRFDENTLCGTCAVVRTEFLKFENDARYRGERVCTLVAAGHQRYARHLAEQGHPLKPLPFVGSLYILHGDSISTAPGGYVMRPGERVPWLLRCRIFLNQFRRYLMTMKDTRLVTRSVCQEFSLVPSRDTPAAYRARGFFFQGG